MDISFRVNPNTTGKGSFFALFNDNWKFAINLFLVIDLFFSKILWIEA